VHQNLVFNAAGSVRGQTGTLFRVKGSNTLHQPNGTDRKQIIAVHIAAFKLFGNVYHQPQIVFDQFITRFFLSFCHTGQGIRFLFCCKQRWENVVVQVGDEQRTERRKGTECLKQTKG